MAAVFADRGGDPDRAGKRDPFDPLLWRAARDGEPCWDDEVLGAGRPGWHIECTAISLDRLGHPLDIQGGGTDLVFPHHEMSAVQSAALTHDDTFARHYVHQAMVGFEGAKMSKSRGNLVLVSKLRADGVDPMAIRLVLLDQHYRTDWDYTPDLLETARARLARWREALSVNQGAEATSTIAAVRAAVADDLDTRGALAAVDAVGGGHPGRSVGRRGCARARGAHGRRRARRPALSTRPDRTKLRNSGPGPGGPPLAPPTSGQTTLVAAATTRRCPAGAGSARTPWRWRRHSPPGGRRCPGPPRGSRRTRRPRCPTPRAR